MGICPTLDFQRNFPLSQLLNIRAFSPQRNHLFNPHFLGNWTGNRVFMAENRAGSPTAANPRPRGSSLCPLNMKLMPIFPVVCQMQTLVFLIAPFPPQDKVPEGSSQSRAPQETPSSRVKCLLVFGMKGSISRLQVTHHSYKTPQVWS